MNILIIQFHQIGDIILTTPVFKALKKCDEQCIVDFLTFSEFKSLLIHNPNINNVYCINRDTGPVNFFKTICKLNKNDYFALFDFQNNPRSLYFSLLIKANKKVAFSDSRRRFFYNTLYKREEGYPGEVKLKVIKKFLRSINIELTMYDFKPEIFYTNRENKYIKELFKKWGIKNSDFVVTISPTHKRVTRRWPLNHFLETAEYLRKEYNAKVIFTCAPDEYDYLKNIDRSCFYVIPALNLLQFTALISKAHLHIGNDSAPHHIATSMSIPTFIILGATGHNWCYPSDKHNYIRANLSCQPCHKKYCIYSNNNIPCLNTLTFEKIRDSLNTFISKNI